jgi:hypothetical protein
MSTVNKLVVWYTGPELGRSDDGVYDRLLELIEESGRVFEGGTDGPDETFGEDA